MLACRYVTELCHLDDKAYHEQSTLPMVTKLITCGEDIMYIDLLGCALKNKVY